MFTDSEEFVKRVRAILERSASDRLGMHPYEIHVNPVDSSVSIDINCAHREHFSIQVRGDVFKISYNCKFDYLNFMVNVEEDLEELASKAFDEIRRVCEGNSKMIPARTFFRRQPMFTLDTADGEQWRFYS